MARILAGMVLLLSGALVAGCGGDDPDAEPSTPSASGSASGSTSGSTSGSASEESPDAALRDRCLSSIPKAASVTSHVVVKDGMRLQIALFRPDRPSKEAAILWPQIGAGGLCGWGRFATRLADRDVTVLAADPCGVGGSTCPDPEPDAHAQAVALVAYARSDLGLRRVRLAGASAGGSATVAAAAGGLDIDGWADISGPSAWTEGPLQPMAASLPTPGLVIFARSDGDDEYAAAQRLARTASARFVDGGQGHGYELLFDYTGSILPTGRVLMDFLGAR